MRASLRGEGWDTTGTHSHGWLEAFDSCIDSIGRNGRHKY